MTIYVDEIVEIERDHLPRRLRGHGTKWCNLWADTIDELHKCAIGIGLHRDHFQESPYPSHYTIHPGKRDLAVRFYGAVETTIPDWKERGRRERMAIAIAKLQEQVGVAGQFAIPNAAVIAVNDQQGFELYYGRQVEKLRQLAQDMMLALEPFARFGEAYDLSHILTASNDLCLLRVIDPDASLSVGDFRDAQDRLRDALVIFHEIGANDANHKN